MPDKSSSEQLHTRSYTTVYSALGKSLDQQHRNLYCCLLSSRGLWNNRLPEVLPPRTLSKASLCKILLEQAIWVKYSVIVARSMDILHHNANKKFAITARRRDILLLNVVIVRGIILMHMVHNLQHPTLLLMLDPRCLHSPALPLLSLIS